eukprot:TRINITY_DN1286_c0_g1_i1.p1 TRINITY_DN1286_c0_g1~~TRINITY_DN1286_c0_g1_i1.p1  ORF type:complete len:164 (-),score=36.76 TRINITY_DN1286_c0_g1_i1:23-514(-)
MSSLTITRKLKPAYPGQRLATRQPLYSQTLRSNSTSSSSSAFRQPQSQQQSRKQEQDLHDPTTQKTEEVSKYMSAGNESLTERSHQARKQLERGALGDSTLAKTKNVIGNVMDNLKQTAQGIASKTSEMMGINVASSQEKDSKPQNQSHPQTKPAQPEKVDKQ